MSRPARFQPKTAAADFFITLIVLRAAGPSADCLRGAVAVGFSLVVYEGGSIEALQA